MRDMVYVKIAAILGLTTINVVALMHGIDSVLTSFIAAIIGGIAGYHVGRRRRG